MTAKRNWPNLAVLLLALLIVVTVWQIFYLSTIPNKIPKNTKSAYTLYTNLSNYVYPMDTLEETDYNQLIDLNFTFQINNLVCNETSPLVLVMIHTAPKNFAKRRTIRETWGKYIDRVKLLFVVGNVEDSTLKSQLIEENRNFSDFTQGSFKDAYRNLTYKHVMLFKYVIYHCPDAKYILKTDDDVFVNMPAMMNFLTQNMSHYSAENLLFCNTRTNSSVLRSNTSKWRVSFSEYPEETYPTHCPGWFLLYSQNVVFNLYKEAQKSKFFWIDDVHLTGTLFKKLNLVHEDSKPYMITSAEMDTVVDGGNMTRPFLIGQANLSEKQIRSLWTYVDTHSVATK